MTREPNSEKRVRSNSCFMPDRPTTTVITLPAAAFTDEAMGFLAVGASILLPIGPGPR